MSNIYYLNTRNERVDFVEDLPLLDIDDFFKSEFLSVSENDIITSFNKGIVTYSLEGDIFVENFDKIGEIFDFDIYQNKRGRFYIGDYFMYCNVLVVEPSKINIHRKKLITDIKFITDKPYWLKEIKYSFVKSLETKNNGLTYPFTYPFTYGDSQGMGFITNDSLKSSDFILYIYGPVSSPQIMIGNNIYTVNTDVSSQEYIVIDSQERLVYKVNNVGEKTNLFSYRGFENSVFEKILPGLNNIVWPASFGFDLYIYDERSRPKWISSIHQ